MEFAENNIYGMDCENTAWPSCVDLDFELDDICSSESEKSDHSENTLEEQIPRSNKKKTTETAKKSRHVPHCLQPVKTVAKRNARERGRIQTVNQQFVELRKLLPLKRKKRIAKEKILKLAMTYIEELRRMIDEDDAKIAQEKMASSCRFAQAQYSCRVLPGSRDGQRQEINQVGS